MSMLTGGLHVKQESSENDWPASPHVHDAEPDGFDQGDDWMHNIDVTQFKEEVSHELFSKSPPKPPRTKYAKPAWSYSCLIALAIKNSDSGKLTVSEIYSFMCQNFPYFRTAPSGWKNSVRHNLSLNKCFEKIDVESDQMCRKSCLWSIRPEKMEKACSRHFDVELDIQKWRDRDNIFITDGMSRPEDLEAMEQGLLGFPNVPYQESKPAFIPLPRRPLSNSPAENGQASQQMRPSPHQQINSFKPIKKESTDETQSFSNVRVSMGAAPPKPVPAILNRNHMKRPRNRAHSPSSSVQALVKVAPPKIRTPKKSRPDSMVSLSSILTPVADRSYEKAVAAITDNSLMSYACQSPYRGASERTTFPTMTMNGSNLDNERSQVQSMSKWRPSFILPPEQR